MIYDTLIYLGKLASAQQSLAQVGPYNGLYSSFFNTKIQDINNYGKVCSGSGDSTLVFRAL